MSRELWLRDKRGVSIMIGYVLLIVIAIALSVMVYAYLKLYLPKNEPECYGDVAIALEDINCELGRVDLSVVNRGLFTIDGVYVKAGQSDRLFKRALNEDSIFFGPAGLAPGEKWDSPLYDFQEGIAGGSFEVEVQAAVFIDNKPVLCENAIARQEFSCPFAQSS